MKRWIYQALFVIVGVQLLISVGLPKHLNARDDYLTYDQLKAYEEKRQEEEWSQQLLAYSQTLVGKRTGQCVLTLRKYFGVPYSEVHGAARSTRINSQEGKVGAVIVFRNLSYYGHVAIIIRDEGDGWRYFDGNGAGDQRGAIRWISKSDPRISGYRIINY